ncbi:glycosyltransferase [Ferruginibacter sp.]|nr:glycosyltransferase [Ferruginibacter sp.]
MLKNILVTRELALMNNTGDIRVLTLIPYKFLPAKLGGQRNIALFFKSFSSLIQTTCVSVKDNDLTYAPEYEVLNSIGNSKLRYINLFYFFTLKKIIKQKQITHLMVEHPYWGWLGILLKIFCRIKLVIRSQNIEAERFKSIGKWWWRILWYYERTAHRFADYNFFIQQDDEHYAITQYKLNPEKCFIITYGFELTEPPTPEDRLVAKEKISTLHKIPLGEKILLFNGTLNYKPNTDALDNILIQLNPLFLADNSFPYKIIICGSKLSKTYDELKNYADKNIIYAGFVDDITLYYKGADILINPVVDGGGIKTKLVEALGYNMNVVTTTSGAIGVPLSITGEKMKIIADGDWQNFAASVVNSNTTSIIPPAFFNHFYWRKIAEKAANILQTN